MSVVAVGRRPVGLPLAGLGTDRALFGHTRYDNGFHQGNRCDVSETLYNAAFGTLLALDLVAF